DPFGRRPEGFRFYIRGPALLAPWRVRLGNFRSVPADAAVVGVREPARGVRRRIVLDDADIVEPLVVEGAVPVAAADGDRHDLFAARVYLLELHDAPARCAG